MVAPTRIDVADTAVKIGLSGITAGRCWRHPRQAQSEHELDGEYFRRTDWSRFVSACNYPFLSVEMRWGMKTSQIARVIAAVWLSLATAISSLHADSATWLQNPADGN